jgi:hypothetical protein
MARDSGPDLDHIRDLAARLAALDPGPAAELGTEIAAAIATMSARVDALWQLISAIVESAGLSGPDASQPPADFVEALDDARRTGRRGVRLSIDGKEWVAALSQQAPAPDRASWSAIERIARESSDQDEM